MTFREDGEAALDWADAYLARVRELPVLAQVRPGDVQARLPAAPPDEPEAFAAVLRDLDEILLPAMTHWQHPRFFAYFGNTGSEPGILAELLVATLNQVGILWRTAPASAELEVTVLDWLAQLLGLPSGWHGHIEDSASISTLAALCAAREAGGGRRTVVCSEHTHSSIDKAARILGLELRKIPVDDEFRMRADLLDLADACAVVATVGTTSTTSVDPVPAIADACAHAGVWLHVDAAYAGAAWVCEENRWSQAGVERAFSLVPEYLRTSDVDAFNISEFGPALGRRFRSLKLWAVLRCYGRTGLQHMIREHLRLAALFESWVRDDDAWELCAPRPFSVVCFRLKGDDERNERLLERVNATGEIFISHTKLHDRYVLRLALGNARTTEEDVRLAWDVLRREAAHR
jgi:aromatic-L-amino-acid decarboxylase